MELARVVGSVNATLKDGGLQGLKLALIQIVDEHGALISARTAEVAVDTQSVGIGELVLVVRGSGARQPEITRGIAADLTIIAIIDDVRLAKPSTSAATVPEALPAKRTASATAAAAAANAKIPPTSTTAPRSRRSSSPRSSS